MSKEYDSTYEGQLQKCGDERSALEQTVDDLSEENQQLRAANTTLKAERDEARREICNGVAQRNFPENFDPTRRIHASKRGWDCYKEVQP